MFTLYYLCDNCDHRTSVEITDGRVHPPPDICFVCSSLEEGLKPRRNKRSTGDVVKGLQLEVYSKLEKTWRVKCLFCLDRKLVKANNIGKQMSCGCLKSNVLVPISFREETVICECKTCGLRTEYDLLGGELIKCMSGC